jgi:hypothetical protein
MKSLALLLTSLFLLASCSEDPTTTNTNTTTAKPWVEIRPDSLEAVANVDLSFYARVNNFAQDELQLDWYFGEGDILRVDKNLYWNTYAGHRFSTPGVYTITVTARDVFADTVIDRDTTIATITN